MSDAPVACQFQLHLEGKPHRVQLALHLDVPVFVRMEVEPWPPFASSGKVVAAWCDGQWDVFEGQEGADPRCLLDQALKGGLLLRGPHGRDWSLICELLRLLTEGDRVHYR